MLRRPTYPGQVGYSRRMISRSVGVHPSRFATVALLVVGALILTSCSASNEVVFEGTPAPPSESSAAGTAGGTTTEMDTTSETGVAPTTSAPGTERAAATTQPTARTMVPATLALSDRRIDGLPGQIVVNDLRMRSVTILGPQAGQVEPFATPGEELQQPTWSPDGALLAWSRAGIEGFFVAVTSSSGDQPTLYPTPFGVFYMQWRPDSRAIALLGSSEPGQVGLAILDLDSQTVTPLNSSSSYYFHWSPEGNEIVTHLGGTRLEQLNPKTGKISLLQALRPVNSLFQAAVWTPDGGSILYVRPAGPDPAVTADELVLQDVGSGEIQVLGEGNGFFNFAVSPDGKEVAYSIRNLEGVTSMATVDLATGHTEEIDAPSTLVWQWSPDGGKILLLGAGEGAMTVSVYQSGSFTRYQDIIPTSTFVQSYLLFWSQYDLSHSLWAPDSSAFVFPAVDGNAESVFLQFLDDELPILLGPGSMAVFSPAIPTS